MAASVDQKKVDEKHIKEIRDFQKTSTANRRCFDCNEMGPQYICLDFNTFICTACSGLQYVPLFVGPSSCPYSWYLISREFSHRIKSISMSTFTDTEVKNIVKFGGNEVSIIWVFEEPKPKAEPVKAEVKKPSPLVATAAAPIDFNPFQIAPPASATPSPAVAFGDFSSFDKQQQPAASAVDFADFSAFDAHQASSAQAVGFADFDSFNSSASIDFFTSPTAAAAAASLSSRSAPPAFEPFGGILEQKALAVDPFASLDIGIKRSSAATTTHATPFHGQPTSSFSQYSNSTGVPVNQQHANPYYSTNQPTVAYHPNNIVVAPV
ncbi:hypothetical protein DYB37_011150 [Aphanomyces astaci]|uniref:Arf-GAP domain-containing protein n=1 Tax=Aphanomyces astaci TaxID=112090 RepID=A0A418FDG2_APHAT|nr:hypothetical protein DYB35_010846 [Aphanomyces astaci]RHZ27749.1 hypothetical protein DYB37_011150 [Aphanomyces astaci]